MSHLATMFTGARARSLARWALGVAVVLFLFIGLDSSEILSRLASANKLLALTGILGLTAMHLLGAATWRSLCHRAGGVQLPWPATLRSYYAAQALGGVTPANLGGDAYRVYALRAAGHGWATAVAPVVLQRATSYLALSVLGLLALVFLIFSAPIAAEIVIAGLGACALAAFVAVVFLVAPRSLSQFRGPLMRLIDRGHPDSTDPESFGDRETAGSIGIGLAFGFAFHLGSVLLTWLLVIAVDPTAVAPAVVAAVTVARLSLAVPITPSGLGVQEAALSLLFAGFSLAPQTALAALLLSRLALITTTLIGAGSLALGWQHVPGPGVRVPVD